VAQQGGTRVDTNPSAPESGGDETGGGGGGASAPPSLANIPRPIMISGLGAIVLLISVFLDWYSASVSVSGINVPGLGSASQSVDGWSATDVAKLVALLAVIAIAAWAVELFAKDVTLPAPAWQIAGGAGALAALLVLYRMVSKPHGAHSESFTFSSASVHLNISNSFGIYLALIAAIATVVGAAMAMREA
jgi:hypothetical protein